MSKPNPMLLALGAALLQPFCHARAAQPEEAAATPGNGITEISDEEMAGMRGRYTVGDNTVAWFGVSMVSTWQTATGQVLESTMKVAMDFSHGGSTPKVTFTPTVNITAANAPDPQPAAAATAVAATTPVPAPVPAPAPAAEPQRSSDASGLQNVSGLVQAVQVAGDANAATNNTQLSVRDGAVPDPAPTAASLSGSGGASVTSGAATASSTYANGTAGVLLMIAGQGEVQQWIRSGSVGQSIQITGDAQQISNRLQLDLVRQSVADNAPLNQNVAQAITLARGIGPGPGH